MQQLIFIGSSCLLCILPLTLYLTFLTVLNRRDRATIISGPWDFVAVLLGLSGFIILGGPLFLGFIEPSFHRVIPFSHPNPLPPSSAALLRVNFIGLLYILTMGLIFLSLLRKRKKILVVYNSPLAQVLEWIHYTLEKQKISYQKIPNGFLLLPPKSGTPNVVEALSSDHEVVLTDKQQIHFSESLEIQVKMNLGNGVELSEKERIKPQIETISTNEAAQGPIDLKVQNDLSPIPITLTLESFRTMQNTTLQWSVQDSALRNTIESSLAELVEESRSPENPCAEWLFTICISLYLIIFAWVIFVFWIMF